MNATPSASATNGLPGFRGSELTLLALVFALGIAWGRSTASYELWPWIIAAWLGLGVALLIRKRFPTMMMVVILFVTFALGHTWCIVRLTHDLPMALSTQIDGTRRLVHIKGIAMETPHRRDRTSGSMGQFDYRASSMSFPMRVDAMFDQAGREYPVDGKVMVRVSETITPLMPGDQVEAKGYLSAPTRPSNPGEFDFRFLAQTQGLAGTLRLPSRDLLIVTPAARVGVLFKFLQWRESLQHRAGGWLLSNLPNDETGQRDVLLKALLLGQREMGRDELTQSFRRIGLAHLMAISGLHIGVLALEK